MANIDIKDLEILNLDSNDLENFMVELGDSSYLYWILGGTQVDFVVLTIAG